MWIFQVSAERRRDRQIDEPAKLESAILEISRQINSNFAGVTPDQTRRLTELAEQLNRALNPALLIRSVRPTRVEPATRELPPTQILPPLQRTEDWSVNLGGQEYTIRTLGRIDPTNWIPDLARGIQAGQVTITGGDATHLRGQLQQWESATGRARATMFPGSSMYRTTQG